jgi:metal-dependent amidase/aminoacylase/carboxypeptidase family protein
MTGHVAILPTVARILAASRDRLAGSVLLVFQPSEEEGGGALAILADGLVERWRPEACFGIHLWNELPVGTVDVRDGSVMANADALEITVTGRGGHAASPDRARDPIVAAAAIVLAAQRLISRETPPSEAAVLTNRLDSRRNGRLRHSRTRRDAGHAANVRRFAAQASPRPGRRAGAADGRGVRRDRGDARRLQR